MNNNTPDLVASTGVNDNSSPWAGLLQSAVTASGNVLTAALSKQTPVSGVAQTTGGPSQPAASAAAPASNSHLLTWLVVGLVVVVAGWFLLKRS